MTSALKILKKEIETCERYDSGYLSLSLEDAESALSHIVVLIEALKNSQKVFEEIGYKHRGVWAINEAALKDCEYEDQQ